MAPLDDSTMMKKLAQGDRQALRDLYERHAEFVYRIAYLFLGNEADARDITQSVFIKMMESANRYQPEAKLTTWIYRIVVNRCLNHQSSASRRLRMFLSEKELARISDSEEIRPDRIVERAEQHARLQAAMRKLPRRQRMALILSRFEGQCYKEIASVLGCSTKSVESLLVRARQSLFKNLRK